MLKTGLLNPALLSLLARVRHTNALVIADRGFPSWAGLETIDLSLVDDVPTVLQVVQALRPNYVVGQAYMAREFLRHNSAPKKAAYAEVLAGIPLRYEAHPVFKQRVPGATGLIRTGDTTPYGNLILVSA